MLTSQERIRLSYLRVERELHTASISAINEEMERIVQNATDRPIPQCPNCGRTSIVRLREDGATHCSLNPL